MQHRKICFIGAGNMAGAIVSGLVESGYPANLISVCAPSTTHRDALAEKYGVHSSSDNSGCAKDADVVVLSVKPQMMADVCKALQKTWILAASWYCRLPQASASPVSANCWAII